MKKPLNERSHPCGLHLAIENQDWVAISGTPAELEQLGRLLIEFARSVGPEFANLDSPGPLFGPGSLGITLYRHGSAALADG